MSLKKYSRDEFKTQPMVELANEILSDKKKAVDFRVVFDQVADMKGFTEAQKKENLAQFYTDLTVDGRFMSVGSGLWGLKRWYPVEQMDEEVAAVPKKKKKKKAAAKKKKAVKKKEPEEEEELDIVNDDIEVLTNKFEDDGDDDDFNDEDEDESGDDDDEEEDDEDKKK